MIRKNILITGASAGLGMGMARHFAAMGRNLALCARRADKLEALRDELMAAQPRITVAVRRLDVNDHGAVFDIFSEMRDKLGSLDRVIINAGRARGKPVGTGSFETNRQVVETNLLAALAQSEAAMRIFREQRAGHLVIISSIAALHGFPGNLTAYSASKAGVTVLAEGLRVEMLRTPVEVSTIFPGYIRSEMNQHREKVPFIVGANEGSRMLVRAIERERAHANVPGWPWGPIGFAMRHLPFSVTAWLLTRIS